MEKIVVTGGCGFIGSHLVKELEKTYDVTIIDKKHWLNPFRDVASYETMKNFFIGEKINTVFDLATLPLPMSIIKPYRTVYKIYCMGINLCELLREKYYKRLIHISSSEVFEPNTPYAAAKDAQDKLIHSYVNTFGINACIARPFNTYGPGQDLGAIIPATIKRILTGKQAVIAGTGLQERDFVYVDDTVKGLMWVLENGVRGKEYNITSEECFNIRTVVHLIRNIMKNEKPIKYTKARNGDTKSIRGKSDVLIKDKIYFKDGLERTIDWWKKNYSSLITPD